MDPSLLGGVLLLPVLQRGPTISLWFFLETEGKKPKPKALMFLFIVILYGVPLILG